MKLRLQSLFILTVLISCILGGSEGSNSSTISSVEHNKNENSSKSCTSQSCKHVQSMMDKLDSTAKQCEDFTQFVCGSVPESKDFESDLSQKVNQQMISALEKNINVNDTEPMKLIKYLYQTCVNDSATKQQDMTAFLDIMEQVGGWPVLKENKWNETAFNWNRLVFTFGNVKHWVNPFFPFDGSDQSRNPVCIYLTSHLSVRSGVNLIGGVNDSEVKKYFENMVDLAVKMGASNKSYATEELKKVLEFEIKLEKIVKRSSSKITSMMEAPRSGLTNVTGLMKNYSFLFPWDDYIQFILPSDKHYNNCHIYVLDSDYLTDIENLIKSTPKRVGANFIIWNELFNLEDLLNKIIIFPKEDESRCYNSINNLMPVAMDIVYAHEYFNQNTENDVTIIFDNVQNEFVKLLSKTSWMDEETRNRSLNIVSSLNRTIGYPKEYLDEIIMDKYLQNLRWNQDNYAENIYIFVIHVIKLMYKDLDRTVSDHPRQWLWGESRSYDVEFEFKSDENALFVPAGILQNPLYDYDSPMYMKYGRIGYLMAEELAKRVDIVLQNEHGSLPESRFEDLTHEDLLVSIAMRAAYHAYKNVSHLDEPWRNIKGDVYTPEKMFWINYASMWCSVSSSIDPLHGIKEFGDDFDCPEDPNKGIPKVCQL